MNPILLTNSKKKKIMNILSKNYGIEKLPHLFLQTGKGKYRIYSGALSKEELLLLEKNTHIEIIGGRFCKLDDEKIRLNFDLTTLPEIKDQITENIVELTDEQAEKWMRGDNLEMETNSDTDFLVLKHRDNFLGSGKNNKTFIQNYVPKERRVR